MKPAPLYPNSKMVQVWVRTTKGHWLMKWLEYTSLQ
jgi:hypothetical protein